MLHPLRPLRPLRLLPPLPLLPLLVACELDDTVIAPVSPGIVVHAVMRPDRAQQFVLVERLFDGVIDPQRNVRPTPPGALQTPIEGASVTVANLDLPADSCGASVAFDRRPDGVPDGFGVPGSYWSPLGCPTMRPGDRLALQVDVPDVGTVAGVTRVPGLELVTLTVAGQTGAPGDTFVMNRDTEGLTLAAQAQYQRALQIVSYRSGTIPPGAPLRLETLTLSLLLLVDSTAVTIPGTMRQFERATAEDAFRGGRSYELAVAVTDTNYYDYVRSSNNEITGRGFINRLQGGIGIFGSLVAVPFVIRATADVDDPREGTYAFTGVLDGVAVDLELAAYLAPGAARDEMSGFLRGTWFSYGFNAAGEAVTLPWAVDGQSVDGRLAGDSLELTIPTFFNGEGTVGDRVIEMRLTGAGTAGGSFTVWVTEPTIGGRRTVGTLAVTKQ